jgi:hypothetical protein
MLKKKPERSFFWLVLITGYKMPINMKTPALRETGVLNEYNK